MTTVVVQAHPLDESFNAALLHAVVASCDDPVVVRLCQGDSLAPELFENATGFVAVYPTWWGSLPAIMLDSFVGVFGPWVDGPEPASTSPLRSVESIRAVTSHGSSKFVNALQGEPGRVLLKRTLLPLCAPGASFVWQSMYKLDRATHADRERFVATVRAR